MGEDRNQTAEVANGVAPSKHGHSTSKSDHESESEPDPDSDSDTDLEEGSRKSKATRKRSKSSKSRTQTSRSKRKPSRDSDSCTSSSDYDSESESESDYLSDSEERRRRRKEKKKEKQRKEKKMRKRREEEKNRKYKKMCDRKKDKGKKGAVTNPWGKYGIIKETDMWNKRPEFIAWLAEVKQVNLKSLPDWEEKQLFEDFMEDHNTAAFPSKKYYDLDAYYLATMKKEEKRGYSKVQDTERTVLNDEEQRTQELRIERERRKEEQVVALKGSMRSGMAQAMKEQAQLREEMAFQYKLGNFEAAAAAIQRKAGLRYCYVKGLAEL